MTTRGEWVAQGSCLLCGRVFAFDPERVCSHPWPPPDGPLAPICAPCITERVNPERRPPGAAPVPDPARRLPRPLTAAGGGEPPASRAAECIGRLTVIYVEHHDGPEQTEAGRIDRQPGWYATCDECGWSAGPCRTEADAHAAADAHDLAIGEVTLEQLERAQRPEEWLSVAWQVRHGRRPDGWWFTVEVPGRPREEHGPFASEEAMLAAKLARIQALETAPIERPGQPGERCTCGRQAVVVYLAACSAHRLLRHRRRWRPDRAVPVLRRPPPLPRPLPGLPAAPRPALTRMRRT
jgi:hypothetical protein